MNSRIALGVVVALLVQGLTSEAISAITSPALSLDADALVSSMLYQVPISTFLGIATGAYVARRGFLIPAITLWALLWLLLVYVFTQIGVGHSNFFRTGQANWIAIIGSLVATVLGAKGGAWLYRKTGAQEASAAP